MTPDHIYDVKDESELYPNREDLGFAYVSINEMPKNYIKEKVMKEMGITDSKVFDQYVKDFNYKDCLVFNYVMVDVNEKLNVSKVKSDIENNIDNALAVINIEEKVHIFTNMIDNYCHEVVYHKHKDLDYDTMKEEIINIIVNIL